MGDSDDGKEQQRRDSGRDRDRSRRGERPSRFSEASVRDRSGDRGHDRSTTSSSRKSSNCRVYVSNICYEYRWQDLKDLFRDHVGDVSFVELFVDESDKPKGCGIVEFSDSSSVKKCMEVMHRFDLKGRKLVIKEDFGNERDKHGNIVNGGGRRNRDRHMDKDWDDRDSRRGGGGGGGNGGNNGGGGGGNTGGNWDNSPPSLLSNMMARSAGPTEPPEFKWGNTYGLSPQFLESLNIHKPLVNRVFVANLDYKVDEKKLREVFKLCGKVADIELYHDKDGNSRGFAVVEYDHPVESVQAISMLHNQMLYDRQMTVRMDRVDHDVPLKLPDGLKGVGMGLGVNGEPLRDVSRNLPNTNGTGGGGCGMAGGGNMGPNSGPGILGAVPNPTGLQSLTGSLGNALQNVVNAPAALANLTGQSAAALQASLSGVSAPFLAGNLGNNLGNDLNLANLTNSNLNSSLSSLNSSLTQNHALATLGGGGGGMGGSGGGLGNNMGGGGGGVMSSRFVSMGNNNNSRDYGRGDSSNNDYMGGGNGNMGGGNGNMGGGGGGSLGGSGNLLGVGNMSSSAGGGNGGMSRDYTTVNRNQDYESNSSMRNYEMMAQDNPDNYRQSNIYSTVNNGSQNRTGNSSKANTGYSDTIIVSNLPISATWKMLKEKFSNAGEVMFVEMKSKDTAIIRYGSEWQAERAIKLMDRVRIDGRTLDVRFFY